ncbi:hypothetical protein AADEFJLK_02710 [Methylovulum psychrotolerans]|uniref:Uncharacterized protein n=1 Tax=Methylovulum psychrotolerans TaxID=1704499 RepID=A0A2S5CKF0_9GAMM|nr:hypothetical protein AADEFJLK_02710 [Methylovulum psychrotolerans]
MAINNVDTVAAFIRYTLLRNHTVNTVIKQCYLTHQLWQIAYYIAWILLAKMPTKCFNRR